MIIILPETIQIRLKKSIHFTSFRNVFLTFRLERMRRGSGTFKRPPMRGGPEVVASSVDDGAVHTLGDTYELVFGGMAGFHMPTIDSP